MFVRNFQAFAALYSTMIEGVNRKDPWIFSSKLSERKASLRFTRVLPLLLFSYYLHAAEMINIRNLRDG